LPQLLFSTYCPLSMRRRAPRRIVNWRPAYNLTL